MADTLSNLVQLALGTASVIQPLLPLNWEAMPNQAPFESPTSAEGDAIASEIKLPRMTGDVSARTLPALIPHTSPRSTPAQPSLRQLLYKQNQVIDATARHIVTDNSRTRVSMTPVATALRGEQVAVESHIGTNRPPTINTMAPDLSRAAAASWIEPTPDILRGAAMPQIPKTQDMSHDQDEILDRVGQVDLPLPRISAPHIADSELPTFGESSLPVVSPKPLLPSTHRVQEKSHGRARQLDIQSHENPVRDTGNPANPLTLDIGDLPQEGRTSILSQRDTRTAPRVSSLPPIVSTAPQRIKSLLGEDALNNVSATRNHFFESRNNYIQPVIPVELSTDAADKPPSIKQIDTSEDAPLIRVHIGRIQVLGSRSVRQPVNQPRTIPQPLILSLSAYLERLDGASE